MRLIGATAAAAGAALLLGVSGADGAPSGPRTEPRPTGPELVAQAAIGVADLRPPAPSNAPPPPPMRHVPIPPRPEAVKVAPGPLGVPGAAYAAYKAAADRMALEAPSCGIEWNLIGAIGRIESGHADGGNVDAAGLTLTPIEGPVLDGSLAGNAVIRDGAGFARAMGPMQFLPTTWSLFGGDNNGDGRADVNNVRDAAYGAARYLCSSASGLEAESAQRVAVFAYNQSNAYVDNVVAWSKAYRDRAIPVGGIPDMQAPVAPPKELPKPLPPGRIVVVGCGTPDGARPSARPGAAGASTPASGPPRAVPPSASPSVAPPPAPGSSAARTAMAAPGGALPLEAGPGAATSTVPGAPAVPGPPASGAPRTVVDCPSPSAPSTPAPPRAPTAPTPPAASKPAGAPGAPTRAGAPSSRVPAASPRPPAPGAAVAPRTPSSVRPAPSSTPPPALPRPPR